MAYYNFGNSFKWFIARVSDLKDPEHLGRVKIRIIHEQTGELGRKTGNNGISDEDLLWAWPLSAIQSSSLSWKKVKELEGYDVPDWIGAVGISPTGIAIGTYVFGFYMDGHEQNIPLIFGTYHKKSVYPEPPTDENTGKFLQLGPPEEPTIHNDVSDLATGRQSLPKYYVRGDKGLVNEPITAYDTEYPYNTTYTTKSGHAIEIDDTPGHERIHIWHRSGSYEEIANGPPDDQQGADYVGRRVKKTVGDEYSITVKNKEVLVKGDMKVEVDGNATVIVKQNAKITVDGTLDVHSKGKMTITSNTEIDMDAPRIYLN